MALWNDAGQTIQYVKFRMPTAENLIPIRVEVEAEGRVFRDTFCWDAEEPDSEVQSFVRKLVVDDGLPSSFVSAISQSIQSQLSEFRSLQNQIISTEERVVPLKIDAKINDYQISDLLLWDLGNMESDPEAFAISFCKDMSIKDPQVPVNLAFLIREQLLEAVKMTVTSTTRESRFSKKPRKSGVETMLRQGSTTLALMKRPNNRTSVYRRYLELDTFKPTVQKLTEEEKSTFEQKEYNSFRLKRRFDDVDSPGGRVV